HPRPRERRGPRARTAVVAPPARARRILRSRHAHGGTRPFGVPPRTMGTPAVVLPGGLPVHARPAVRPRSTQPRSRRAQQRRPRSGTERRGLGRRHPAQPARLLRRRGARVMTAQQPAATLVEPPVIAPAPKPTLAGHLRILRVDHWFKFIFVIPGI